MGFVLRTVFWLGLAMVILPPQARLGGRDTADFGHVDLNRELHNAASAAWSFGAGALQTCDTNPQLCKAGRELLATTLKTGASLVGEAQNQWQNVDDEPTRTASDEPRRRKKIQARVE